MAIEKKKEEAERALYEAEQMEAARKAQAQRAQELAEDKRRREEAARREAVGGCGVGCIRALWTGQRRVPAACSQAY